MKETLVYLRELNNFSQGYVAKYLGVSRQMYSKYENSDVEPSVSSVIALCKLYKVSYDVLLENQLPAKKDSVTYRIKNDFNYNIVASPAPVYEAKKDGYYYQKILSFLPRLSYSEELNLLSKLAHKVEVRTRKTEIERNELNLSESQARELFEYFSGKGEGLDYNKRKRSYLTRKHLSIN